MVAIFETVENGKSIIKGISDEMLAGIFQQMNDKEIETITVTEKDDETNKTFTNIFLKRNIVKVTTFKEE